jgi:hypothetical protein
MGQMAEGIPVRFTQKETAVYGTLLGSPKTYKPDKKKGASAVKPLRPL